MPGGRKTFYDKSCPHCGLPSIEGRIPLNRTGHLPGKSGKRKQCCVIMSCQRFLHPELQIEQEGE